MKSLSCILIAAAWLFSATVAGDSTGASDVAPAIDARPFFFALSVADVEGSAKWYQRVLGFELLD